MIILVHGWGFQPSLWDAVEDTLARYPNLPARQRLDLGFFAAPQSALPPSEQITLAVGHSYGSLWLLQRTPPTTPLLVVNGFAKFCTGDGQQAGTPPRVVDRMLTRLGQAAEETLNAFRLRCGAEALVAPNIGGHLGQGLENLRNGDARAALDARCQSAPQALWALAGDQDSIVSPALTRETFAQAPNVEWVHGAGHLLPLSHPQVVAQAIVRALGTA